MLALHGFAGHPSLWDELGDFVAPSLPGHNHRPPVGDGFEVVVDHLAAGLSHPTGVVGYSLGARLALALALRYPDRVRGAVLFGGTPGIEDASTRAARIQWDDGQAEAIATDIDAWAEAWATLPIFATQEKLPPEVRARQDRIRRAHDPAGLAWAMRTLGQGRMPNLWPELRRSEVPICFVAGARDDKYVAIAMRAAERPNVRCELIDGAGHNPLLEAPGAARQLLQRIAGSQTN